MEKYQDRGLKQNINWLLFLHFELGKQVERQIYDNKLIEEINYYQSLVEKQIEQD